MNFDNRMKRMQCLIVFFMASALLCSIPIMYPSKKIEFRSDGGFKIQGEIFPATIIIDYTEYSWWIRMWSDFDGELVVNAPNFSPQKYDVAFSDGNVLFYRRDASRGKKVHSGLHTNTSKSIYLHIGPYEFNGPCNITMGPP